MDDKQFATSMHTKVHGLRLIPGLKPSLFEIETGLTTRDGRNI